MALSLCMPAHGDDAPTRSTIGAVERVKAPAQAEFAGDTRALQPAEPVYYLDLLRTGQAARLRVALADASTLDMGENAELRVDAFVTSPPSGTDGASRTEATLNLLRGALLFIGDKLREHEQRRVLIRTPVAILGVRGTDVWVGPIDGATGVLVVDGEVLVSNPTGQVRLRAGEGTMIASDGTLSPRKLWGEAKVERALEMVRFE
jgi:hypothetical protein